MAVTLIAHTLAGGGANGFTSSAINTSTATLIGVGVASYLVGIAPTISDSAGNTGWVTATMYSSTDVQLNWFYCLSPITSVSHTFTISGSSCYARGGISAWSGVSTLDQTVTGSFSLSATSFQPGSQTTSANGDLVICAVGLNTANTLSVDSSFTILDQGNYSGGAFWGLGHAYLIQSAAGAVNPTWTYSAASNIAGSMLTFLASGGPAITIHPLPMMGIGI